jgi:hypothetical protein
MPPPTPLPPLPPATIVVVGAGDEADCGSHGVGAEEVAVEDRDEKRGEREEWEEENEDGDGEGVVEAPTVEAVVRPSAVALTRPLPFVRRL